MLTTKLLAWGNPLQILFFILLPSTFSCEIVLTHYTVLRIFTSYCSTWVSTRLTETTVVFSSVLCSDCCYFRRLMLSGLWPRAHSQRDEARGRGGTKIRKKARSDRGQARRNWRGRGLAKRCCSLSQTREEYSRTRNFAGISKKSEIEWRMGTLGFGLGKVETYCSCNLYSPSSLCSRLANFALAALILSVCCIFRAQKLQLESKEVDQ